MEVVSSKAETEYVALVWLEGRHEIVARRETRQSASDREISWSQGRRESVEVEGPTLGTV